MTRTISGVVVVTMLTVSAAAPAAGQEFMRQLQWSEQSLEAGAKKKRTFSATGAAARKRLPRATGSR
jgi:hypothetical protein